jgi:hypothetical protein
MVLPCSRREDAAGRATAFEPGSSLHAEKRRHPDWTVTFRARHDSSHREFVKKSLGFLEIERIEAFGKPVIDLREHRTGLLAPTGISAHRVIGNIPSSSLIVS